LPLEKMSLIWRSCNENETFRLGKFFGETAKGGETLALSGDLGAGKTRFVKGLAEGLGIDAHEVTSPTYLLVHCFLGRLPLCHIDLYRLERPEEAEAFGLEEYFEGGGLVALEWAEKAEAILPLGRLKITIDCLEAGDRAFHLEAFGARHQAWLEQVEAVFPEIAERGRYSK